MKRWWIQTNYYCQYYKFYLLEPNVPSSIKDILDLIPKTDDTLRLTISRKSLITDAVALLKTRNIKYCQTRVTFEGEPALDAGGVTREFFSLAIKDLLSPTSPFHLFEGRDNKFLPVHNTDALRSNLFKVAGRLVALSLLNEGSGFPVFSPIIYKYFINPDPDMLTELSKDDVTDYEALEVIDMVRKQILKRTK